MMGMINFGVSYIWIQIMVWVGYNLIEFIMYKEKRVSNKLKQKQLQTKYLQEQTKKMEDKLGQLKKQIEQQKKLKAELGLDNTVTRWQKSTGNVTGPLKSYAKQILQQQKQAYNEFGINQKKITGTKAFEGVLKKIKQEKEEQQQRNPKNVATFFIEKEVSVPAEKVTLQNNFFKAKMDVKKLIKQKTLEQFLEQNYILEYLPAFKEQGIDDLESLRYIQREKLQDMGVKAGHQIKIVKKIKEEFDKMLQGKSQEPKQQKQQKTKVQSGYGDGNVQTYNTSEQLPPLDQKQQDKTFQEQYQQQQSQQNNEQYEIQLMDQVMITAPMQEMSMQVNEQTQRNCYQCYKIINDQSTYQVAQKHFCCQKCMDKYLKPLQKVCPSCERIFLKTEGYRQKGLWFCSLGCCPNHQQIQDLFFQWHRQH